MAGFSGFHNVIGWIRDGELVRAAIANRGPQAVDENVRYLRELFEAAMLGETLFARAKTVEIDAKVGQAVFYNGESQRFERALGQVECDDESGAFMTSLSTQVWGLVYRKLSSNKADILLHGVADVDLTEAVDETVVPGGLYYLSNSALGKLERQRPPVGVTVMMVGGANDDGTHHIYVNTKFHDFLEAHRHYKISLTCFPAGNHSPPIPGERHAITSPNADLEGWLPAGHSSFDGKAPAGAVFGYNIEADARLKNLWPPLPTEGAYLEWDKAEDKDLAGMAVPLGEGKLCVVNRQGIWWMSDCYGDVPWPVTWTGQVSVSESESVVECPRNLYMGMTLYFAKPIFQTTGTVVSSLVAGADSGLVITCPDNDEFAKTGHLLIDLDLGLALEGADDEPGYLAFKRLDGNKLYRGPVVESIEAGSANVTLSSEKSTSGKYSGNVIVTVAQQLEGQEMPIDTVWLDGVMEEHYRDLIALGFEQGREARYRGRVNIPADLSLPVGTRMKLRFQILSRSSSEVPAAILTLSYRRILRPAATLTPVALPTTDTNLGSVPSSSVILAAVNQYFEAESDAFDVASGDTVLFWLERGADAYNGDLFILRQRGVLVAGS